MKIVYIVQAPHGLPQSYSAIDDRTVLISWREETPQTTIFAPNSTWTEGRNAAWSHIISTNIDADYFVFLDDDIAFEGMSFETGISAFEVFLKTEQPEIALPRCWDYNVAPTKIDGLPREINRQGLEDVTRTTQPVDWFDACFNAFSRSAFQDNRLFPYVSEYDAESWFTSQFLMILKANLHFRNEVIQNNRIAIRNKSQSNGQQADYPRSIKNFPMAYEGFLRTNNLSSINMSRLDAQ